MVSFERTKLKDWGVMKATKEEWDAMKSLISHVAQPEIFSGSGLDMMSGLQYEDWVLWNEKFSRDKYKDEPPKVIHRSELNVLFMTAVNVVDAKVQGLTEEHKKIIDEIWRHDMSEALYFNDHD